MIQAWIFWFSGGYSDFSVNCSVYDCFFFIFVCSIALAFFPSKVLMWVSSTGLHVKSFDGNAWVVFVVKSVWTLVIVGENAWVVVIVDKYAWVFSSIKTRGWLMINSRGVCRFV